MVKREGLQVYSYINSLLSDRSSTVYMCATIATTEGYQTFAESKVRIRLIFLMIILLLFYR